MKKPQNITRLRNALVQHKQSNLFNPRSLNVAAIDTPMMKILSEDSGEILQQRLEELIAVDGHFAFPQEDLVKWFTEKLKANSNRIKHIMRELGWRSQKCKWGGVDYSCMAWVHPNYQIATGRVTGPDGYDEPVCAIEEEVEFI